MPSPLESIEPLPYERFAIDAMLDSESRFRLDLDSGFPFAIKFRDYHGHRMPHPLTWHDPLEIFIPTHGRGALQMGDCTVEFAAGDLIVVDSLKLHGLVRFEGQRRCGVVIVFASDLVYRAGSPVTDMLFLSPFHLPGGLKASLMKGAGARELAEALTKLIRSYLEPGARRDPRGLWKVNLLGLLYLLSERIHPAPDSQAEYRRRQGELAFLDRLHGRLVADLSRPTTVDEAARILGMGRFAFMRNIKRITGVNFVAYLRRLRLEHSINLLQDPKLSIAEVAAAVGFSDQSYFDRLFRARYRCTPRAFRSRLQA